MAWNCDYKVKLDRKITYVEGDILDHILEFMEIKGIISQRVIEDKIPDNEITFNYEIDVTGYYMCWAGISFSLYKGNYIDEDYNFSIYFDYNEVKVSEDNKNIETIKYQKKEDITNLIAKYLDILYLKNSSSESDDQDN